ncbi:hypothetical protein BG011_000279 [Mortierella polycephala]|uniref:Disease resistance R13L4/SHOC-2-like LRR domain-containing protein n=1 Tax=Mortierella polycephala TaxID=41804 RepID=A0A9P6Q966_9FUNG|nr:hypothetical protein BG011_000279 [Mortierella polycephala]
MALFATYFIASAADPIIFPPSGFVLSTSASISPAYSNHEYSPVPTDVPSVPTPLLSPSPSLLSTPTSLSLLHNHHSSYTKTKKSKPTVSPTIPSTSDDDDSRQNRAAFDLQLVHVPLKRSCEILRQLYNSTGGNYWSNQDGWQYVDSVTIPPSRGSNGRSSNGIRRSYDSDEHKRRSDEGDDDKNDGGRKRGKNSSTDNRQSQDRDRDELGDDEKISSFGSSYTPSSMGSKLTPYSSLAPLYPPVGDTTDDLPGPVGILDPDNCCGWYGVVCIGPDGVIPPPWPPYDDDLITSSALIPPPPGGSLKPGRKSKRDASTPLYFNIQDRNRQHHDGHIHGDNGGGEYLRMEHRRLADDGASEDKELGVKKNGDGGTVPPAISTRSGPGRKQEGIDDWYIIELHLGFNGLSGPVPKELSELANLMILDISNNDLTGEIPGSYGNLTRLRRLDVSSNKITGAFPTAVTKMTNIQELVLKNNYLKGPLPSGLMRLKQLTELSIANNDFDGVLPKSLFTYLPKLRVININQNGFTGQIDPEIGSLNELLKFNLGDNHFIGEIPDSLYGLQNLRVLDIPENKLSGRISPKIGNLISMTRLVLSHNDFTGPLPIEIQNMTKLEFMAVNYNSFDGMFPIAIAPPRISVCLVQPNAFSACPPNASVDTPTTLAYQCNLDCRDRVIHPELYDSISEAQAPRRFGLYTGIFGLGMALLSFVVSVAIQIL